MQAMSIRIFFALFIFALINPSLLSAATEQRIALVIGNSQYTSSPLKNPVNDATDVAATLKSLGFNVILKTNATKREMGSAVEEFGKQLKGRDVGLFYYAGHGVQLSGVNYLIPVSAKINEETDIEYEAIDAGRILATMYNAKSRVNIVILDACRDNPYVRSFRSATRGLAIIAKAPMGTIVSYSTSPGDVARDGKDRNSPYTSSLIQYMKEPGLSIEQVFKNVRQKLNRETRGKQIPWELSSLQGEFYFVPGSGRTATDIIQPGKIIIDKTEPIADSLDDETMKLEDEDRKLEKEKVLLEKKKALEDKRQKIEEEKATLEAKKTTTLAMAKRPPQPTADETTEIELVFVKGGCYQMGFKMEGFFGDGQGNEKPVHEVCVSNFYIGKYEVTQGQWKKVMGSNPSYFSSCGDDCPVENVSWNDVQEFIRKLNATSGKNYRLPTEAEWEYAARSGGKKEKYAGTDSTLDDYAWYISNSDKKTHSVGQKKPNGLGIYDMTGNVWEWCADWYGEKYYVESPRDNPRGPGISPYRVLRGGSGADSARLSRAAARSGYDPDSRYYTFGFRIVVSLR